MSKFIHPITLEAAYQVASQLREDDLREAIRASQRHPYRLSDGLHRISTCQTAGLLDWLVFTKVVGYGWCVHQLYEDTHHFARESKRFIEGLDEPYLWNIVDNRNTVHIKLLKFLGFTLHDEVTYGPNNLTFTRFDRVRTSSGRHQRD